MEELHNFIDMLREQRHDFMNNVQVIYGYLQIGKKDEALKYIEKIADENQNISKLYALGDKSLAFSLEVAIKNLWKKGFLVEVDFEIESLSKEMFLNEYHKKNNIVNTIFKEMENSKFNFVYIYFFQDELGESLLICNSEACVNELDWMEDWEEIEAKLGDINIHKYFNNEKKAYRLTFN